MSFRGFSKNLSDEIENLFANLGDNNSPEKVTRLDKCVKAKSKGAADETLDMDALWERIKTLDVEDS